jgi:dTMP kinase
MMRGKLIVIDGGDGSGKATQANLLIKTLTKLRYRVKYFDFPRYDQFFGKLVKRFLAGEFGQLDEVSPYLSSMTYALDRYQVKDEMEKYLNDGWIVICNRFTTSNLAHQSAKYSNKSQRQKMIDWIEECEYRQLKIPKEDIVVYLKVPPTESSKLLKRKVRTGKLAPQDDIAEKDIDHQINASTMYQMLAKKRSSWLVIECADRSGNILPIETIHSLVVQSLCDKLPNLCNNLKKPLLTQKAK